MDEQVKNDSTTDKSLNESGKTTGPGAQFGEWQKTGKAKAEPLVNFAQTIIKDFPGVTITSWSPVFYYREGENAAEREPTVQLELTGPELAVKAFLSYLGLARNIDRIMIVKLFSDAALTAFRATLNPNPDLAGQMKRPSKGDEDTLRKSQKAMKWLEDRIKESGGTVEPFDPPKK
jgi:hypothetical protein